MKAFGPAINDPGPGSDLRLVQAALANLHILADLLERARLDVQPHRDADPAADATNTSIDAITAPKLPTGTPPEPATASAPARGLTFWDER